MASPIPAGLEAVIPALAFHGAAEAMAWYEKALNAKEVMRFPMPDGSIAHAEMKIGAGLFMLADEMPPFNKTPKTLGGTSFVLSIYVEDCDTLFNQAVAAGAKVLIPIADQFYGDRSGRIEDPFGYVWIISTHLEDVSPDDMQRRFDAWMQQQK
jgi:PhnB protein